MKNTIKTFKYSCSCGGYAWQFNRRPESQPHLEWCPQFDEYARWFNNGKKFSVENDANFLLEELDEAKELLDSLKFSRASADMQSKG